MVMTTSSSRRENPPGLCRVVFMLSVWFVFVSIFMNGGDPAWVAASSISPNCKGKHHTNVVDSPLPTVVEDDFATFSPQTPSRGHLPTYQSVLATALGGSGQPAGLR